MPELVVFIGSESDKKIVGDAGMFAILDEVLGRAHYAVHFASADRNAAEVVLEVQQACLDGAKVFIGIAGLAAVLPGAIASASGRLKLVIGAPLDDYGLDPCLRKPKDVPVATAGVGKDGVTKAALLACQALAIGDPDIEPRLASYLARTTKPARFYIDPDEEG